MKQRIFTSLFVCASILTLASPGVDAQTLSTPGTDASPYINTGVSYYPPPSVNFPVYGGDGVTGGGSTVYSGAGYGNLQDAEFVFQLPTLGNVSNPFTSASLALTLAYTSGQAAYNYNVYSNSYNLYGLTASFSSSVNASDFYAGSTGDSPNTLLQGKLTGYSVDGAGTTYTVSNSNLLNFLNGQYADGAGQGAYITLQIAPDFSPSTGSGLGWNSTTSATTPATLSFTDNVVAAPEPSTYALLVAGLLSLTVLARRRNQLA